MGIIIILKLVYAGGTKINRKLGSKLVVVEHTSNHLSGDGGMLIHGKACLVTLLLTA